MSRARHKKADGGRTDMWVSGNPDVKKEAEGRESYDKGDERKKGGRAKHKKAGGAVHRMAGGPVKARADRVARASGGRVGSDRMPMSSAHSSTSAEKLPKSEGGN
jgi:hypothetical protein